MFTSNHTCIFLCARIHIVEREEKASQRFYLDIQYEVLSILDDLLGIPLLMNNVVCILSSPTVQKNGSFWVGTRGFVNHPIQVL